MSDNQIVLRAESLAKQFGTLTALRSASLKLARGEFVTIFGRNGAGKTTFLKIVAGLIRSYRGSVHLFDEDCRSAGDLLRRRFGFVSHESLLYQDLTVRDNLLFYGKMYGVNEIRSSVERTITEMGLEAKASSLVRELSRGMRQRLSLGRAFLHDPHILLLDEPFTGLDDRAAAILDGKLTRFKDAGRSVIMATHNAERGWKHADSVAVLDRGIIVYNSAVKDTTFEKFRAEYLQILSR
ncbi:MAG: heme ABC exporter ATP-binding protein CcmA [Candidatus Krumholzibacteria bacterium]|nr:heme ABC exporter ATP-binding protein CcmA [Candidatus Krumholzibacteria bacterium]